MKDYPYNILKQDVPSYEILLHRDQHGKTFADIARACELPAARVVQKYYKIKMQQIRLYIQHISVELGHLDTLQIKKVYDNAFACYQDLTFACAYLEKKYPDILTAYRAGEPGMPAWFMKNMPPFRTKLRKKTIVRVVEMREAEKAPYAAIAKELRITPAKAKHTYEWFYHKQVVALLTELEQKAESPEEKAALWAYYFKQYKTSKKRYDALTM